MMGWKVLVKILEKQKVKFVFGLTGGAWEFWDFLSETNIRPILVRHENSSVFMAMAFARLTGEPGICFNSPGPGTANIVPGILEAYAGCIPVIAPSPCAEIKTEGMGQIQETDMVPTFKPMTKWSVRVTKADKIPWTMRRAFSIAVNGKPGPVFVEIPSDIGYEEIDLPQYNPVPHPMRIRGDPTNINNAIKLLLGAERPIIVAGGGVILSRAYSELRSFAETLAIPVFTTASGRGSFPEDHPLALGLVGIYRTKVGKEFYEDADLLITIGSKNEELETAGWHYFPKDAKFIQIDIDPFEIGRNWIPDVAIIGDAKLVLNDLSEGLNLKVKKGLMESDRIKDIVKSKEEYENFIEDECKDESIPIKPRRIVRELNKVFNRDTILANENGSQDLWSYYFPYYKVFDIVGCMGMPEQTCFGLGVIGAIGAKLTRPEKKVVCTTGDGAFQFSMKELPTAVQYDAPVTWVIMNNFSLGWERFYQKYWLGGRYINTMFEVQPDFVKIAEANRCYGQRIEKPDDIKTAFENALKANKKGIPAVLDFIVDPSDWADGFHEWHHTLLGKPTTTK